jgi:hypothetical protein
MNNINYQNIIGIFMFMTFFTLLWAIYNLFIRPADAFPSNYLCIFILSILCEFFEYLIGARARLSDIINNMIGYTFGSLLYKYNPIKINIDNHISKCTFISIVVLIISITALYIKRSLNY